LTIVTASVDSISVLHEMKPDEKIRIKGRPIYVGTSSIECQIMVEQLKNSVWQKIINSYFTMVALNKDTNKPTLVNRLEPKTEEDIELFEMGKSKKKRNFTQRTKN
jgi:acyl-CoA hydrolase